MRLLSAGIPLPDSDKEIVALELASRIAGSPEQHFMFGAQEFMAKSDGRRGASGTCGISSNPRRPSARWSA